MKTFQIRESQDAVAEEIVDPDLPIIDTHHQLRSVGSPIPERRHELGDALMTTIH